MRITLLCLVLMSIGGRALRAEDSPSRPDPPPRVWDFEQAELTSAPDTFRYIPELKDRKEEWLVAQDGMGKVFRQQDFPGAADQRAFAIAKDLIAEDVQLSVRIRAVSGVKEQSAGVVWRFRDPENHLLARLDVEDKRLTLVRVVDGNRVTFGEKKDLTLVTGMWYLLRVDHRKDRIQLYLDHDVMLQETDRHFDDKRGSVGLWTANDSVMEFDDFTVRKPARH